MTLDRRTLLNNRYRIIDILGQGGMASVYRAIDENLGVEVAVKDNLFTTEEYARQFRLEATILASLRHPNMPRVTDHFVIEGQGQYLVMDYIEGEDLRQRMDRVGILQEEEVIVIGIAICEAMIYLHSRNPVVLHRDIKPGNVKIDPHGQIFLVDFGLAKVMHGSQATTTGARAMTPGYSPPEQYGTARTDHRSDIYSLGATLYSALTDALPEDGLARAMDQTDLTPIREHNQNVTRRLASVIEKALAVRPDDRYQSAEDFRQSLLNARSSSRRKIPVELVLEPPPEWGDETEEKKPVSLEREAGQIEIPGKFSTDKDAQPLLPASFGGSNQSKAKGRLSFKQRKARQRLWTGLATLGLVFLFAGITYFSDQTGLLNLPVSLSFQPASSATQTPSAILVEPVISDVVRPTEQEAAYVEPSATVTPSPTMTSTTTPRNTPQPTRTPSPIPSPTQFGGGWAQIAFASDREGVPEIFLMNTDGSNLHKLTNIPEGACQPSWSPDGSRLVFISPCRRISESYPGSSLFIINYDGTDLTPLPSVPGGDYDPAWSPDGTKIAFTSIRNNGRPQIFLINLKDNQVTQLADVDNRDNLQPSWSPNGNRLVFVGPRNQIWIMDADGLNRFLISRPSDYFNRYPRWSPDGQSVVFTQFLPNKPSWLATVKPEPLALSVILAQDTPMSRASYSPDGYWLVFSSWPDGIGRDLYIMTHNGVGRQRLTEDSYNNFDPVWRPGPK